MHALDGIYHEEPTAPYVTRRAQWLGGERTPTPLPGYVSPRGDRSDRDELARTLSVALGAHGFGAATVDELLGSDELVGLAEHLGQPIPERSPAVQPFVEHEVVLNLRPEFDETGDVERQPFATNFISLHTEGSMAAPDRRPDFLLFQCLDMDVNTPGGKTVVVPMQDVVARLPQHAAALLRTTAYRGRPATDPILNDVGGTRFCTFRDFMHTPLEWTCWTSNPAVDASAVNAGLQALYDAMYAGPVHYLPYAPATLLVFDNRRFFHGRTRITHRDSRRHLQRIRIATADGERARS